MLDFTGDFALWLPLVTAGIEPSLEVETASGGATSVLGGIGRAAVVLFSLFEAVAMLDFSSSLVLWLPLVGDCVEPSSKADSASGGLTSTLGGVWRATSVLFSLFEAVAMVELAVDLVLRLLLVEACSE